MKQLFYELIVNPKEIFLRSSNELRNASFLILFLTSIIGLLSTGVTLTGLLIYFFSLALFTLLYSGSCHFTARIMRLNAPFSQLFYSFCLSYIAFFLVIPAYLLVSSSISTFIEVIIYAWASYLVVTFIKTIYKTSVLRAIIIYLSPLLLLILFSLVVAILLGVSLSSLGMSEGF